MLFKYPAKSLLHGRHRPSPSIPIKREKTIAKTCQGPRSYCAERRQYRGVSLALVSEISCTLCEKNANQSGACLHLVYCELFAMKCSLCATRSTHTRVHKNLHFDAIHIVSVVLNFNTLIERLVVLFCPPHRNSPSHPVFRIY